MALTMFRAFRSTVTAFTERMISSTDRWLVDPVTGAITGVQSPTANGPDARFVPVDITAAQLANPPAAMLADIDATYRLNVAPFPRYFSNGTLMLPLGSSETETVVPSFQNLIWYAPVTIAAPEEVIIEGQVRVQSYPA